MPQFFVDEIIARPVEVVWNTVVDFQTAPEWMRGIDSFRSSQQVALGATLVFEARGGQHSSEVTKFEAPNCIELTSTQGPVTAVYTYSLKPEGDATRISLHAQCTGRGIIRIFMPLLGWLIKRSDGRQMSDLRAFIDRGETR